MGIQDKVMPSGNKFIEYAADKEPWAQYTLENGAILRLRVMVSKIIDTGQLAPDGAPLYNIQMQQVMDMTWPDDIKREIEARQRKAGGGL